MSDLIKASVELSTIIIFILCSILAGYLTKKYVANKLTSYLYWSSGMWFFAIGVFLEILFAFNIRDQFLIQTYLLVVVVIVELLALGSISLVKSDNIKRVYLLYCIIISAVTLYFVITEPVGNLITNYVVFGPLPLGIIASSSLATFPAALILIVVAAQSYRQKKNNKMLSIIIGTIIVSIAGGLYIAKFPAFLYIAEFIGIILLWFGFF
ncbi:MAG: hypothetical protein M1481_05500 [Candidatus Thermoplasmatota archaeon]|jgi:hypothetical protein|nr:hypothetical protein [Candidatus Thermoplasmatota archaeon]MCL5963668.1 hypothetical protein [Candidatus Thermoplasmatota archaeon]